MKGLAYVALQQQRLHELIGYLYGSARNHALDTIADKTVLGRFYDKSEVKTWLEDTHHGRYQYNSNSSDEMDT